MAETKMFDPWALENPAEEGARQAEIAAERKKKPKQADQAIGLGREAELFHDRDIAYARFHVRTHYETSKVRGKGFKTWLRRGFFEETGTAIGAQALEDALGVLEGMALYEGRECATHVRIAGDDETIYLDLGDDLWQVVMIDADGWRITTNPPIRFRRPPGMQPLPTPEAGGSLFAHLGGFLNMEDDEKKLFIACLVAAFRPQGPYPALCLHGEQGSAKSTAARIFRSCIDPNSAMLRSTPREERDMMIAGTNGWVVAFDNLSHLQPWVSDALCRIATGSGFGIRQLYEDDAEVLFQVQRPVVLNGIEDLATRGDLLDRSVLVYLPAIPEERRMTERNFLAQFEEALPLILGALLNVVSAAIRNLPSVELASIPRMADFAEWVCAAEPALGWMPDTFLNVYRQNRTDSNNIALEASPIVSVLIKFLEECRRKSLFADAKGVPTHNFTLGLNGYTWVGTPTELHNELCSVATEREQKLRSWPKSVRTTSASLKRLSPNLRAVGVEVEWGHEGHEWKRVFRLKLKTTVGGVFASASSASSAKGGGHDLRKRDY